MIVKNKTVLTKEEAITDLIEMAKKDFISRYVLSAVCVVCGILLLIVGATNNDNSTMTFSYIFFAMGVAYTILTLVQYFRSPAKVRKVNEENMKDGMSFEYTFKEQSLSVTITQGEKKSKGDYPYLDFKKIREKAELYEFILPNGNVLVAKKSGFENKKMEEFFIRNVKKNKKAKFKQLKNSK